MKDELNIKAIDVVVTEAELIEFIKSKGDAPIDMKNNMLSKATTKDCGCLFVEYIKSKEPDVIQINAGFRSARVRRKDETTLTYQFKVDYDAWFNKSDWPKKFSDLRIPS